MLGDFTLVFEARGSGHHRWGALGILVPDREKQTERFKRGLNAGHPA